ncbi:penicillin-binding protein 2 [Pseudoalteromonas sp. SG43-7]|jgi:penicillin-binding protein 2|uniref:Peptidoglycan D,D-transpeptidase MrdA n=1 Tax=Pseudoalteromonas neustonica TaxID=1840331 RepID=A0ABY3FAX0_9GAMM|nr:MULTISPECIES: penicillin-binding protein 2 [Pseudoalteromonas]MBB1292887.1 penicillin-binding protein 2 [Pseudoalteromonas sp. SR41-4]MBB1302872.1 penicillin-binding protein 2 [Pseudoalteromonas sp. SR44-8]MBB1308972.1 penicillin-binding protein 2 [Pseudoalteromonas sp. SR41-8]MBB1399282.1 penicillin-binding protein 2 [Pseudoalteromonas sp. SG44-8]MBB1410787.1 penicillin-binding protein 2 [Pseudoalteromonas sp. SG44-17]|tara:strand:- start:13170 stop:15038 length:1869 start_codon:yes stop_codon:yes gene_type:complete
MRKHRPTIRDHSAEANLFARRAFVGFVFVTILVAVLLSNLYTIQVDDHQDYQTRSNDNRIKVIPIAPNRGLIYDRNGVLLAENKPVYNLEVIPEEVDDLDASLSALTQFIDISEQQKNDFLDDIKHNRRFKSQVLKARLNEQEVARFSVNQYKFPGFSIEARLARYYPFADTLTHALGYVAKLNKKELAQLESQEQGTNYRATHDIGKLGIEKYYEQLLHGQVGSQRVEVNNRGRVIRTLSMTPPQPGNDLVLTLDVGLQQIAQHALKDMRGAVVVMDAKDGGVLALYSNPSYDPNLFVHGISSKNYKALLNPDRPLINRTTQGRYAPASTVKPHMAVLALEEGLVTEQTSMWDPGFFQIPNVDHKWRDWKRWGHGHVDVYKAIEESCDTYFYDVSYRLGITKISDFMAQFGYGDLTGIDIHEETTAILPSKEWKEGRFKESWWRGDTISVGIGQGYWTATPLQIANAMNILVNRGINHPPHLVQVVKKDDEVTQINNEEKPPIFLKEPHHWQIALDAMHNTVQKASGTAHKAFKGTNYDSAGKTGTAQIVSIAQGERYDAKSLKERQRDNTIYVGFAPYEDPRIVVSVVLENNHGGVQIARQLMDYYFAANPVNLARNNTP